MTKVRKSPTILKPIIDEKMAIQFASAGTRTAAVASPKQPSSTDTDKNVRQILLTLKRDLYDKIAKDAARKGRTIEEHLAKHLIKRYK